MSTQLPDYVASAQPVPMSSRVAWYKSAAQTYAGVMLWFVFWQDVACGNVLEPGSTLSKTIGGTLATGLMAPILAIIVGALICHFGSYLAPGLMGQKTGLSLAVVGTSTYGTTGGFLMPGFLMGVLQFGWLSVNAYFSGMLLAGIAGAEANGTVHFAIGIIWACGAAFIGLKGVQYVAKVATFLPIIPVVILLLLFVKTMGGLANFDPAMVGVGGETAATTTEPATEPATTETATTVPQTVFAQVEEAAATDAAVTEPVATDTAATAEATAAVETAPAAAAETVAKDATTKAATAEPAAATKATQDVAMDSTAIFMTLLAYIVGFFATAGAAGVGISSSCRTAKDAHLAGWGGVVAVTCFSGILGVLIVAGAYGTPEIAEILKKDGTFPMQTTALINAILGDTMGKVCWFLLAISAFPSACFCSLVAAQSFQNTLPKVNPYITCGLGTLGAVALIVTTYAGQAGAVFGIIGASFGPICGAMTADYLLAGCKWPGPRAGFNPAGWLSWAVGFVVGAWNNFGQSVFTMPCPPVCAIVVGFVLYILFAKMGMLSKSLEFNPSTVD